jgi:hypothetical protein
MGVIDAVFSVLMVGHSLFGQDGPDMLQAALRAGQGEAAVSAQIINGAPLRYNWDRSDEAEGVDARSLLPGGTINHLILTEAIPLANHLKWSETEFYGQAFAGLAVAARADARVYVQETWHSLKSGTGAEVEHDAGAEVPWRARLDADLPLWEGILASIEAGLPRDGARVELIPAGQAMARLHDEIAAGRVAGLGGIEDVFADDIHLNDIGHYFVAMVQYAVLTGESPEGLPNTFRDRWGKAFDAPSADLAKTLQRIAREAVLAYQGRSVPPVASPAAAKPPSAATAAPATGPPLVLPDPALANADAVEGRSDVAIGLAPVTDWSVQQPFLDVMKTARPWIGHLPHRWGGMETETLRAAGFLGPDGWPLRMPPILGSIGTLVLTDMPPQATSLAGTYRVRFEGSGVIEVTGRAQNVRYGENEITFDYTPGPGSVDLRIQRINVTDPPRNITMVPRDKAALFDAGEVFNPDWTRRIGQFKALRFMDWMETNDSAVARWEDRPKVQDVTYAEKGVPVEVVVALANQLGVDAWFNMPHLADDTYVRNFASYVKDHLHPGLKAYVEFSNEVWNWQFGQARWAGQQAEARWGEPEKGMQYYGLRAAEVAAIWSEVFGTEAEARLVNVISTQTGWLGLETEALDAPLARAEGRASPATAFDAYAISGYFGGILGTEARNDMVHGWLTKSLEEAEARADAQGLAGEEREAFLLAHRYDHATRLAAQELRDGAISGDPTDTVLDLQARVWPYHAAVARAHELDLIMYEGGTHLVGIGPQVDDAALTSFFQHFNYTDEMGALYKALLAGWKAAGGQLFNAYADVYAPTKWGSWGALRHLDDVNARWNALRNFE